jgi:hypothetical protein
VRPHAPVVQQLFQRGAQQRPVVIVRLLALGTVDDHAAHGPLLEQRLVHAEVTQIGQQLGALLRGDGFLAVVVGTVQRPRGIVRITRERVRRHRVFPHPPHGTGPDRQMVQIPWDIGVQPA